MEKEKTEEEKKKNWRESKFGKQVIKLWESAVRLWEQTTKLWGLVIRLWEWVCRYCDIVILPLAFLSMVVCVYSPVQGIEEEFVWWFCRINGVLGLLYIVRTIYLWLFNRVKLDWILINGHLLRKVGCVVLLMPFVICTIMMCAADSGIQTEMVNINGYEHPIGEKDSSSALFWSVYYHFIDPGNQHMAHNIEARNWAALIAVLGVFLLNGLLVSSVVGWVEGRKDRWSKGLIRYGGFLKHRKHYIIIGGNDMVSGLVRQVFDDRKGGLPYILIQTSSDVEQLRQRLFSFLNEDEKKRVIIHYGNRNVKEDVEALRFRKAKEVYILGEESRSDDMESYHDTMNMKCLQLIAEIVKNEKKFLEVKNKDGKVIRGKRLVCRLMFEYASTFNAFQFSEISNDIKERVYFRPFNRYEMWAQRVLVNRCLDGKTESDYLPLEGLEGIGYRSEDFVHVVIVGMTRIGAAMALETAHVAHYPNFETEGKRSKITIIDNDIRREMDFFMSKYRDLFALSHWRYGEVKTDSEDRETLVWHKEHTPSGYGHLGGDFVDVEWEFIEGNMAKQAVQDYILDCCTPNCKMTIAVCLAEASHSIAAALHFDRRIYERALQVLVYNRYGDALINEMECKDTQNFYTPFQNKLRAFGMAAKTYDKRLLEISEKLAKINDAAYNEAKSQLSEDTSKKESAVAKSWSNIYNANTYWTKYRCMDWTDEGSLETQKEYMALTEHNRWVVEKLIMQFRPLSKAEQDKVLAKRSLKYEYKSEMAHLDICSNARLREIDDEATIYDRCYVKQMEEVVKEESDKRNDASEAQQPKTKKRNKKTRKQKNG